jgi:HlyD family secretion protein
MTKKSKIKIAAIVIALIACAAIVLATTRGGGKGEISLVYETAKVEPATISTSVTATGTIEPVNEVEVGTQVSGIISKIYVDYNSVVKKGQVIAELDRTNLESELTSAKANLTSAKSELDYQTTNLKRIKELHGKGYVSDDEYDNALLNYKKALESYKGQQQTVSRAQTNLGYATITAPIDGVVLSKDIEEGQTVASSFSTPTLFTIAHDLTDMRVIADVDEADIGGVHEGQRVSFTVDAYPDDTFSGTVTQVRQQGEEESNVVTYEVVISAPNKDLKLKPKLTANVNIYTQEVTNVLSVPSKAMHFTPTKQTINKGEKIKDCNATNKVWVKNGNVLTAYAVKVGMTNGIRTEILSGVKQGTEVIIGSKAKAEAEAEVSSDESSGDDEERSPFAPGPRKNNNKKK